MKPRYKIGMRNIKTAVAVGICLLTVQLIGLASGIVGLDKEINGIQAALAATICMKSSLQNTLKTGVDRTIGTVIGSAMGVLFLLLSGSVPNALFVLLITGGVVVIIYLCNVLRLQASVPISIVVYLIILIGRKDLSPLAYGMVRLAETVYGIFVAYVVNRFLDMRWITRRRNVTAAAAETASLRAFTPPDTGAVMHIWLRTHIAAHSFIDDMVWHQRYESVRSALPSSDTLLYDDGAPKGFICVTDDVITALAVAPEAQGRGIATQLLDHAKASRACMSTRVFKRNETAVKFLLNRGFVIAGEMPAPSDIQTEYVMEWSAKNRGACRVPAGLPDSAP
jgi:ribosomal protein S18 acetylase RimI-like enzyme